MRVGNLEETRETYDFYPDSLVISSPGKFEGEPAYAPFLWDAVLSGFADFEDDYGISGGCPVASFNVDDDDRAKFPNMLDTVERVEIWEDSQGFVHTSCHSICPNCDVSHHGKAAALCTGCNDAARVEFA